MDVDYPRALLVALAATVVLALGVTASTSGAAFGAYNPAWDGASDLRATATEAGADAELARDTGPYGRVDPNRTTAVILSPDTAYDPAERRAIERFVRRGGTLVVAEDFGAQGDAVLEAVGASVSFDGGLLRDERYYYRSPALPLARNVSDHPLTAGVERLTLNYGTPVVTAAGENATSGGNVTTLASTSEFAYVDANRDGDLDDAESMGTYRVATVESVGAGRVVAIGDPSLFINAMLERSGNRAFVSNLLGSRQRVVLDYSHVAGFPPLALAILLLREIPLLQLLVGGLGLGAIGLWVRGDVAGLRERFGPEEGPNVRPDPEELRAYLTDRHPDWEEERVDRVIQALINDASQSGGDE